MTVTGGSDGANGVGEIVLIFPPAVHPTSPPLGIAFLKAYLDNTLGMASVKTVDLNLRFHAQALNWVQEKRLRVKLAGLDPDATATRIREVVGVFQGREGLDTFLDPSRYDEYCDFYRRFTAVLHGLFDNFARRILTGMPVPPLIHSFFEELLGPLLNPAPKIAGFSILFSQQLIFACMLAKLLKARGSRVALGGATLSVMPRPDRLLTDPVVFKVGEEQRPVDLCGVVDWLMVGEGERGLSALIASDGEDLGNVPGLLFKHRGRVWVNPPEALRDLDELPLPDFSGFQLESYHSPVPVLPYLSSRGCFWRRCAFCTHQKTYLAYREESVEKTVNGLAALKDRHGVDHFNLVDEMIHPNRFRSLSRALMRKGVRAHWSAYAKPTRGFDGELLKDLHGAGLRVVLWGVESGSQRVLDAMRKGVRVEDARTVLTLAHGAGIWNLVFLLFGFPSETEAEWAATLTFLEDHRECVDAISKSRFVLVAGSEVMEHPSQYGISQVLDRQGRDPISIAHDYRVSAGLTPEEVQARFERQIPMLESFGRSPHFGALRDHLLIHASRTL